MVFKTHKCPGQKVSYAETMIDISGREFGSWDFCLGLESELLSGFLLDFLGSVGADSLDLTGFQSILGS